MQMGKHLVTTILNTNVEQVRRAEAAPFFCIEVGWALDCDPRQLKLSVRNQKWCWKPFMFFVKQQETLCVFWQ